MAEDVSFQADSEETRPASGGGTILAVEDEPLTRTALRRTLTRSRFQVLEAGSGEEALALCGRHKIDLVLLDILLPGMDGFEVCRRIRSRWNPIAVLMLTQLGQRDEILRGLVAGADDYIVKPYDPAELVARINAVLRRTMVRSAPDTLLEVGDLVLDYRAQRCFKRGRTLNLTPKEFALLAALCDIHGQDVSRTTLARLVWGEHHYVSDKSLDVYIRRLRQKVEDDPDRPKLIRTVRGYGYVCRA